jgi:uncharacterized membrane protein YbhN (UPF0104 family)
MPILDQIFNRRTLGRWILGVALLGGLIIWVDRTVGWPELLSPWREFPPAELGLLLLLTTLSYLIRAVRVYDYSYGLLRGAFAATLRLSVLHNTLNNFLPMRLGELAYPILMKRYFGQDYRASGATLIWIRGLDLHFLGLVALGFLLFYEYRVPALGLGAVLGWILILPGLYWGHGQLRQRIAHRGGRLARLLLAFLSHMPDSPGRFLRIWLWTVLSWTLKLLAFTAVVLHFVDIPFWRALLGTLGAELSSVLPVHGVAGSGSYELAMAAVLIPLGLDMNTVLKAAVNLHLYLLGANLLLGLGALLLPVHRPRR